MWGNHRFGENAKTVIPPHFLCVSAKRKLVAAVVKLVSVHLNCVVVRTHSVDG